MKILIAGIGGVGGYFGGLLARHYEQNPDTEIYFLARGGHLKKIREEGLKVIRGNEAWYAKPKLATDDPTSLGVMDWIVICTKGYDLENVVSSLAPCISSGTTLLPLLNGVDAAERIRVLLPEANVIEGCVYIIARWKEPGVVENSGPIQQLYFGSQYGIGEKLIHFEMICKAAGIEATLTNQVLEVIWEKFIFISPLATITSCYNIPIGKVREDHPGELYQLIYEVCELARAKGILVPKDIIEKTAKKINGLGYEHTSSMHSDFQKGTGKTEVESLTGYLVRESAKLELRPENYERMYRDLLER